MSALDYHSYHLVGIKGVAMTALAQCLLDAGKLVTGSDVAEAFVTQPLLEERHLSLQTDFNQSLPNGTECVIYTAAHGGINNPQVVLARSQNIPVFSHAQALGDLFNQKQGIAVCGVGGKSTTSAMIAWILEKTQTHPSYAVGVGNIPGLDKTGYWAEDSKYFVAEADEYAEQPKPLDPDAQSTWKLVPRFHYLNPWLTICTNLRYDHPDVYQDFEQTKEVYQAFFNQIKPGGSLICSSLDKDSIQNLVPPETKILSFGESETADFQLLDYQSQTGKTQGTFKYQNQSYTLELKIPGKFNIFNALAALAATTVVGVPLADAIRTLGAFKSTMRRFELIGEKNGVVYYDDYAHHPNEVAQAIAALKEWYPSQHNLIMFQSHTYSRTKQLFDEFVTAFADADEVVMIDIFPSARESQDPSVTSDLLCQALREKYSQLKAQNLKTIDQLAAYCQNHLKPGDVAITLGAGDIYHVHELL